MCGLPCWNGSLRSWPQWWGSYVLPKNPCKLLRHRTVERRRRRLCNGVPVRWYPERCLCQYRGCHCLYASVGEWARVRRRYPRHRVEWRHVPMLGELVRYPKRRERRRTRRPNSGLYQLWFWLLSHCRQHGYRSLYHRYQTRHRWYQCTSRRHLGAAICQWQVVQMPGGN